VHKEKDDCCHNDNECVPEIDCMVPHCVNGNCQFELGPGCCDTEADCNDNDDICTADSCVDNQCVYELLESDDVDCCLETEDCDLSNPCLEPSCGTNHKCEYAEVADCCLVDDECDDGDDECTEDLCVGNGCVFELTGEEGCCLEAEDCPVSDICMEPQCGDNHLCFEEPVPNCCHEDAECDDGDELCTIDTCIDDQCVYTPTGAEGCCEADSDCVNPDLCMAGTCNPDTTSCTYEPISGCCHTDDDCDDGDDDCTDDTCVDNQCLFTNNGGPGCCEEFTWEQNFDSGDGGFDFVNQFDFGLITLGWQVSGACGFNSPSSALYYGSAEGFMGFGACSYIMSVPGFEIPLPSEGTATSQSITLPPTQDYTLTFQVLADIEPADNLELKIMENGSPTVVWEKADLPDGLGDGWQSASVDLSAFAGKTVKLSFSFSTQGTGTGGTGVIIDDLSLTADCNQ